MTVKSMLSGILAAAAFATGVRAASTPPEANLSNFKPASGNDGIIATEGARPWEAATPFDVRFWFDYAQRPVARDRWLHPFTASAPVFRRSVCAINSAPSGAAPCRPTRWARLGRSISSK